MALEARAELMFLGNDTIVILENLVDSDGATVDSATVEATLFDANNLPVTGQTWPLPLPFVSSGKYQAQLDKAVNILENQQYEMRYTVVNGVDDSQFIKKINAVKNFI